MTDDKLALNPTEAKPTAEKSLPPLLRPQQVEAKEEELQRLEAMQRAPDYVRSRVHSSLVRRHVEGLKTDLELYAPKPYKGRETDQAREREAKLREDIVNDGMLSQEGMRRSPPGAVDAHMAWEKRNKRRIQEWKNIRLRLRATGDDLGYTDASNLERYRPREAGGTRGLDAGATLIGGKSFYMPAGGPEIGNLADEDTKSRWKKETAAMLAAAAAEGDKGAKAALDRLLAADEGAEPPAKEVVLKK